ncbi:unnamed protein product [Closterium sp. Naga37s-1]|nr:unnamed protein product [Closterium sp. Naga37s-1]
MDRRQFGGSVHRTGSDTTANRSAPSSDAPVHRTGSAVVKKKKLVQTRPVVSGSRSPQPGSPRASSPKHGPASPKPLVLHASSKAAPPSVPTHMLPQDTDELSSYASSGSHSYQQQQHKPDASSSSAWFTKEDADDILGAAGLSGGKLPSGIAGIAAVAAQLARAATAASPPRRPPGGRESGPERERYDPEKQYLTQPTGVLSGFIERKFKTPPRRQQQQQYQQQAHGFGGTGASPEFGVPKRSGSGTGRAILGLGVSPDRPSSSTGRPSSSGDRTSGAGLGATRGSGYKGGGGWGESDKGEEDEGWGAEVETDEWDKGSTGGWEGLGLEPAVSVKPPKGGRSPSWESKSGGGAGGGGNWGWGGSPRGGGIGAGGAGRGGTGGGGMGSGGKVGAGVPLSSRKRRRRGTFAPVTPDTSLLNGLATREEEGASVLRADAAGAGASVVQQKTPGLLSAGEGGTGQQLDPRTEQESQGDGMREREVGRRGERGMERAGFGEAGTEEGGTEDGDIRVSGRVGPRGRGRVAGRMGQDGMGGGGVGGVGVREGGIGVARSDAVGAAGAGAAGAYASGAGAGAGAGGGGVGMRGTGVSTDVGGPDDTVPQDSLRGDPVLEAAARLVGKRSTAEDEELDGEGAAEGEVEGEGQVGGQMGGQMERAGRVERGQFERQGQGEGRGRGRDAEGDEVERKVEEGRLGQSDIETAQDGGEIPEGEGDELREEREGRGDRGEAEETGGGEREGEERGEGERGGAEGEDLQQQQLLREREIVNQGVVVPERIPQGLPYSNSGGRAGGMGGELSSGGGREQASDLTGDFDSRGGQGGAGQTQGVLGQAQGAAGETQGAAGEAQGAAGEAQGAAGEAQGAAGEAQGAAGEAQGAAGEAQGAAGEAQGAAGEAQGAAGEAQGAAGEAQGAAGEAQGAAGEAQGAAGEAQGERNAGIGDVRRDVGLRNAGAREGEGRSHLEDDEVLRGLGGVEGEEEEAGALDKSSSSLPTSTSGLPTSTSAASTSLQAQSQQQNLLTKPASSLLSATPVIVTPAIVTATSAPVSSSKSILSPSPVVTAGSRTGILAGTAAGAGVAGTAAKATTGGTSGVGAGGTMLRGTGATSATSAATLKPLAGTTVTPSATPRPATPSPSLLAAVTKTVPATPAGAIVAQSLPATPSTAGAAVAKLLPVTPATSVAKPVPVTPGAAAVAQPLPATPTAAAAVAQPLRATPAAAVAKPLPTTPAAAVAQPALLTPRLTPLSAAVAATVPPSTATAAADTPATPVAVPAAISKSTPVGATSIPNTGTSSPTAKTTPIITSTPIRTSNPTTSTISEADSQALAKLMQGKPGSAAGGLAAAGSGAVAGSVSPSPAASANAAAKPAPTVPKPATSVLPSPATGAGAGGAATGAAGAAGAAGAVATAGAAGTSQVKPVSGTQPTAKPKTPPATVAAAAAAAGDAAAAVASPAKPASGAAGGAVAGTLHPRAASGGGGEGAQNETLREKRRRQRLLLEENPLVPVTCRRLDKFRRILRITLKEAPIDGIGQRDKGWRKGRDSIEWRKGTTYLQPLDADCLNIASFFGKVGQLLLINNASKPALPHPVDRFMFPRAPQLLQAVQAAGKDSWHVVVLRQLLGLAVAPMLGETALKKASMAARRFIGTEPLAGGLVEFEPAFEAASETRPLCFGKVVIPGKLKAITYPGGPSEAEMFKAHLGSSLGLPNPPLPLGDSPSARAKPSVQLLFIRRNRTNVGGRRILDDGSDGALYDLFYDMGFKIRRADFTRLSFRQQYEAVLNAEVIVGVHGAGLTSAAAFARNRSVVLEIMPHNTFNPRYYFMAVQAGVSYFLHQLRPGAKQPLDEEFETLTVRKCSSVPDCRKYFYEDRLVNVTKEDLEDLKVLLGEARTFVRQARWNLNWAGKRLRSRYETLCSAGKARDIGCRMDLIRSPVADVKTECVMKMDCLTVNPMLADDLDDIM